MNCLVELTPNSLTAPANEITDLLDFLPVLYPGGDFWLPKVLAEVESGTADGFEVRVGGTLAGVLLGCLKSSGKYKIRTLFVAPRFRGQGVGRSLLLAGLDAAKNRGARAVYITFAHTLDAEIAPLLQSEGFCEAGNAVNRYGIGRHEVVYDRVV